ncbi:hypothetical protein [Nitriliruptor alkaliphilus]|uniref:hypothetical protein n=1 Tax=Nitriliruptor alkaliphilus TaxID=427918 RepID=UPI000697C52E|nr:hypothetical protein [Nitriliruptor alkaliphilus]
MKKHLRVATLAFAASTILLTGCGDDDGATTDDGIVDDAGTVDDDGALDDGLDDGMDEEEEA